MRVVIAYHFFAHYRRAVMESLAADSQLQVTFVGDASEASGTVEPWQMGPSIRFVRARCFIVRGILVQPGLVWHLVTHRYDRVVLLGNAAWPAMWLAALVARAKRTPLYFWTHGWVRPDRGMMRRVRSAFYALADGLLLYGHYAKCLGVANGFAPERLHVIYNSLDYDEQRVAAAAIGADAAVAARRELFGDRAALPMLICSSRLMALRRLDLLLDAMALLVRRGRPVNLLLIGDGPERHALETQASQLKLSVHFFGACYDEPTLARLTIAADLTVAPGKVGLTAMQSLGYGTPVLTHGDPNDQMPEWEAIVPGKTGAFFASGDAASLADAIDGWFASGRVRDAVRRDCHAMIERLWNAANQHRLIRHALTGEAADDLAGPLTPASAASDRLPHERKGHDNAVPMPAAPGLVVPG